MPPFGLKNNNVAVCTESRGAQQIKQLICGTPHAGILQRAAIDCLGDYNRGGGVALVAERGAVHQLQQGAHLRVGGGHHACDHREGRPRPPDGTPENIATRFAGAWRHCEHMR